MKNYTLWMLKPDAIERGLEEAIYNDIRLAWLEIIETKRIQLSPEDVDILYQESKGQPYYPLIVEYITRNLVEVFVIKGENALNRLNELVWSTDPGQAEPDSLRRRYGTSILENTIHSSTENRIDYEITHIFQATASALLAILSTD